MSCIRGGRNPIQVSRIRGKGAIVFPGNLPEAETHLLSPCGACPGHKAGRPRAVELQENSGRRAQTPRTCSQNFTSKPSPASQRVGPERLVDATEARNNFGAPPLPSFPLPSPPPPPVGPCSGAAWEAPDGAGLPSGLPPDGIIQQPHSLGLPQTSHSLPVCRRKPTFRGKTWPTNEGGLDGNGDLVSAGLTLATRPRLNTFWGNFRRTWQCR